MNKLQLDSSETTRETFKSLQTKRQIKNYNVESTNNLFNFENYDQFVKPQQIKKLNIDFLEWFIGFFEAEGSFCNWFDGKKDRFQIEINQKDPKLMYKIKKNLGFGNVTQFKQKDEVYWCYSTSSFINIKRFILLFNGNFITYHKNIQFYDFLNKFNQIYTESNIILKPKIILSLNSYWLSGFLEGDGGFFVVQRKILNKKKLNIGLKIKFYITQKNELKLLTNIKILFQIPTNIYKIYNGNQFQKYNHLETCNLESLKLIKNYLEKYPFLGQRKILVKRWIRLIDYKLNDYPLTVKSSKKLTRLILSTKKI